MINVDTVWNVQLLQRREDRWRAGHKIKTLAKEPLTGTSLPPRSHYWRILKLVQLGPKSGESTLYREVIVMGQI
jgi:hypothetical protein